MDIFSHGLWGGVAVGRKNKKQYLQAVFFGAMPDLFSFGIFWFATILGLHARPDFSSGRPDASLIPDYVNTLYNWTHSLIVFAVVFGFVWLIKKRPQYVMAAWGIHILMDIPTHSLSFFATPFLWPVSDFKVDGINWGNPMIFIPNIILLITAYLSWLYFYKKTKGVS